MHGLSVRLRVPLQVHFFKNSKPICGTKGAVKDSLRTWQGLSSKRCKKCVKILKKKKEVGVR